MKQELRKKYLEIRKNIIDKDSKNEVIFKKIINDEVINKCDLILIYLSYNNEVDTINIINYFLDKKKIAVPRIDNGIMNFYYIKSISELRKGYYGILEPITNNVVRDYNNCVSITPGICFDKLGYRIGYGKGFYDRFYSQYDVYKIGLCYRECLINKIENNKYDIAVDKVITD